MKIKKTVIVIIFALIAIFFLQNKVSAVETTERTTILDITTAEFATDKSNSAEGWDWNATTNTLTLTNVNFNTGNSNCIRIPSNKDINLVLNGKNKLNSIGLGAAIARSGNGNKTLIITGPGEIEINSNNKGAIIDAMNFILKSGTVKAIGGSINTIESIKIEGGKVTIINTSSESIWSDGLYACGSIEISGGTVDISAARVGLFVPGTNKSNPTTGLKITGGKIYVSGALTGIYTGPDNQKDVYIDTTETVDFKDSPIGIYVSNGNLTVNNGKFKVKEGKEAYRIPTSNPTGNVNVIPADYTKVNQAIARIPADLSLYTTESIDALNNAKNAVVTGKNVLEQNLVDGYAKAIENAINALSYQNADYTKVNQAIARIPADLSLYSEESINALNAAKNAVVAGKNITEQAIVDGYATAIINAINALSYKEADYTKVNQAIAKIPADLSIYTLESINALNTAKNAVVAGKNITEQATVDGYATAIENAINSLKLRKANYAKVDEAISKIPTDLNKYTFESVKKLNKAVESVVRNKDISQQAEVDMYATKIQEAINNLEEIKKEDINNNGGNSNNGNNNSNNNGNNNSNNNNNNANNENKTNNENDVNKANNESNEDKKDTVNANIVKTGDNIVITTILFVIALAGTIITFKLNKKANN